MLWFLSYKGIFQQLVIYIGVADLLMTLMLASYSVFYAIFLKSVVWFHLGFGIHAVFLLLNLIFLILLIIVNYEEYEAKKSKQKNN
jgi:hypothetical protein